MVKIYKVMVLVGVMLASSLAAAQAAGKIAVLDMQIAVISTDEAQKRLKALEAQPDFDSSKKQLDKLKKEYDDQVKQLQKDVAVMSPEQKEAKGKQLESKRSDMEHIFRKLQGSRQELLQNLLQEIDPKFKKVLSDLIKSENIGVLLDARTVIHAEQNYDITNKVTEALNKAN